MCILWSLTRAARALLHNYGTTRGHTIATFLLQLLYSHFTVNFKDDWLDSRPASLSLRYTCNQCLYAVSSMAHIMMTFIWWQDAPFLDRVGKTAASRVLPGVQLFKDQGFPLESLNQIDEVVTFRTMSCTMMGEVLDKHLWNLKLREGLKKVTLGLDLAPKEWLIERGVHQNTVPGSLHELSKRSDLIHLPAPF
ncbi:hypothetical protein BU15DRAFT_65629 [Melanogaster broomeanus]|nr:hypothetical protein BU15DRAFT_65629 [Melanogaster broomeanus]